MRVTQRITRATLVALMVGLALLATSKSAHAYPPPAASATVAQGCPSATQGASCTLTFQFLNGVSQPVTGAAVTFAVSGAGGGTVNPAATTTDANGFATTTFTASAAACGSSVVTATSGTASAQTTIGVVCAASASAPLPNTSTGGSGTSPLAYLGIALAAIVLIGGAVTLRLNRPTA